MKMALQVPALQQRHCEPANKLAAASRTLCHMIDASVEQDGSDCVHLLADFQALNTPLHGVSGSEAGHYEFKLDSDEEPGASMATLAVVLGAIGPHTACTVAGLAAEPPCHMTAKGSVKLQVLFHSVQVIGSSLMRHLPLTCHQPAVKLPSCGAAQARCGRVCGAYRVGALTRLCRRCGYLCLAAS